MLEKFDISSTQFHVSGGRAGFSDGPVRVANYKYIEGSELACGSSGDRKVPWNCTNSVPFEFPFVFSIPESRCATSGIDAV